MKKFFWIGLVGLLAFEVANVYFIMPMPGSQEMNSIDIAYFLYKWRWAFRGFFAVLLLWGLFRSHWKRKWLLALPLLLLLAVIYLANFKMAADHMFYQPKNLLMQTVANNKVDSGRLVIGIERGGEAKAYPIQFLGYHHQLLDTLGGSPVLVTYCTVCRTGRVYDPRIEGKLERFRLVGMDHFNAMLEDEATHSWWRQVTGEAIKGRRKGERLQELYSTQTSLAQWLRLHPASLIMQPDPAFQSSYDSTLKYESGASRSKLTGTDSLSWKDKSWVIGVKAGKESKAYDWNRLKQQRLIEDRIGSLPVLIVLGSDDRSFFAFERADSSSFTIRGDTLITGGTHYRIDGKGLDTPTALKPLPAYQEFWHSWRYFNPGTKRD